MKNVEKVVGRVEIDERNRFLLGFREKFMIGKNYLCHLAVKD
jgi:hypothetical protein